MQSANNIKEKYASMPDGELLLLAEEEYAHLTEAAKSFLDEELKKRNLTNNILSKEENNGTTSQQFTIASHVLNFLFDAGEYNKSPELISEELSTLGIATEDTASFILQAKTIAAQRYKKAATDIITGSAIGMSGIALLFLPINIYTNRLVYIIAGSAIIYGLFFYIRGWYNKSRFKKIIRNLSPVT